MKEFDVIASTVRNGVTVDAIEFEIAGAPPANAYLLGKAPGRLQPGVIAFHDDRGDKATLLDELEVLANRGFVCLGIDSPGTRHGTSTRDPLGAFSSMLAIGRGAMNLLQSQAEVLEGSIALLGRGIGAEVAARVAALSEHTRVVVGFGGLPNRGQFVASSDHALAAGLRRFHGGEAVDRIVSGLAPHALVDQLEAAPDTSWFLQHAADDDRLSGADRKTLTMAIPRTVRVSSYPTGDELRSGQARRDRLDFITRLCG